jgi:hypothetical protein
MSLSILLEPFRIFLKFAEIFAAKSNTGGKFATGVVDTAGCPLTCEYLREFSKNFKMTLLVHAWGKMVHQKNVKKKAKHS